MSFASDSQAAAAKEVSSLQREHALRMGRRYLRLEKLGEPVTQRCSIYDYLRLQGVAAVLIPEVISKLGAKHVIA